MFIHEISYSSVSFWLYSTWVSVDVPYAPIYPLSQVRSVCVAFSVFLKFATFFCFLFLFLFSSLSQPITRLLSILFQFFFKSIFLRSIKSYCCCMYIVFMCIFAIAAHSIFFRLAWAQNINVFYYHTHHSCVQCVVANRNSIWSLSLRYIRSRIFFKPYIIKYCIRKYVSQCIFASPISPCVCAFVYAFYISFCRINAQLFIRHRVFSAWLSDWLTVYIVVHRIHTLAHTPTQPKNVDSFSIVVFGFAYCLCGFVEWIHHPFGVIRNPRKTCRCLSYFR